MFNCLPRRGFREVAIALGTVFVGTPMKQVADYADRLRSVERVDWSAIGNNLMSLFPIYNTPTAAALDLAEGINLNQE
jgi:hypothetical protein